MSKSQGLGVGGLFVPLLRHYVGYVQMGVCLDACGTGVAALMCLCGGVS